MVDKPILYFSLLKECENHIMKASILFADFDLKSIQLISRAKGTITVYKGSVISLSEKLVIQMHLGAQRL